MPIVTHTGKHHTGMLHEVIDTLHEEGLDIVEARAAVAGGNPDREHEDVDAFVVRPRGKQKDFDDEKLKVRRATHTRTLRPSLTFPPPLLSQEIKHHLMEMLGHGSGEIDFTPLNSEMKRTCSRSLSVVGTAAGPTSFSQSAKNVGGRKASVGGGRKASAIGIAPNTKGVAFSDKSGGDVESGGSETYTTADPPSPSFPKEGGSDGGKKEEL